MPSKKVFAVAFTGLLIGPQVLGITQLPVFAEDVPAAQPKQFDQNPLPPGQTYQQPFPPTGQPGVFGLTDGTLVKLKLKESLSSKSAETNDSIELEVVKNVKVGDIVVIPEGALAKGVVTEVKRGKMLGHKGKLSIAVSEVTLATGERVALRANKTLGGGMSAGGIAANVILTPLSFFFGGSNILVEGGKALFRGSNVTYKAGTEVEAFINGNYALDPAKFTTTR